MNFRRLPLLAVTSISLATLAPAAVTMNALSTFGGGDGWLAAGDSATDFLNTGNNERGLAYNPVTNHLIMVSRSGGNNVRIMDSATGADLGGLSVPAGTVTGGTFAVNQVRVGGDGAIYVGNLASPVSGTTAFKVYRWADELPGTLPTLAYTSNTITAGRLGDNLDLMGSGAGTVLAAGESTAGGSSGPQNGYLILNTADGSNYNGTLVGFVGTPPATGDFNRGLTFVNVTTEVLGKGSPGTARLTNYAGANGTLVASPSIAGFMMDYAVVGGVPLLATLDISSAAGTNVVRIYNMTDPALPILETSDNLTTSFTSSAGSVGSITWGAITGNSATLYALNVANGIQAFQVVVPEPSAALLMLAGVAGFIRRRRS